jgi:hemolysin III
MTAKNYTSWRERLWLEELLNTISHGIGAIAAIIGFIFLMVYAAYSPNDWALFSSFFYGISLIAAYLSSTFYHGVKSVELKRKLLSIDQACIFLLIAGTYTPFLLITFGGVFGWTIFAIQWGTALFGILLKFYDQEKFESVSLFIYIVMGWLAMFYIHDLYIVLPRVAFGLVVGGGVAYSIGVIFYLLDAKVRYAHFIWHLFVILGSSIHYYAIFFYLL